MTNTHYAFVWSLAMGWLAITASGCANLSDARQSITRNQATDIGPIREKRNEEVAHVFDQNRDNAEYEAAASCWQRGDVEGSKMMLTQLLERNPNYRRARFVLADIYLFDGDTKHATDELRKLVDTNPNDAMAHHALAQVLDAEGDRAEALSHYQRAVQLDPKSEVYAISYKTAAGLMPSPSPSASTLAARRKGNGHGSQEHPGVAIADLPMPPTTSKPKSASSLAKIDHALSDSQQPNQQQSNQQQSIAAPTRVDDWVRPIDLGNTASDDSARGVKKAGVDESRTDAPVIAGPVTSRRMPSDDASGRGNEPSGGYAVAASYAAPPGKAVDAQNRHEPLQQAVEALARGDNAAAIEASTAGLSQSSDQQAPLYRVLGAAHYRLGEYQAAQKALAQALSLDKTDALSYFLMGSTQAKLGHSEMAARCFAEAARLDARYGS